MFQKSNPPAYECPPELGYVRMGLAAAAFGIIAGVAGAMTLFPSSDLARTESALAMIPSGPVMAPSPMRDSAPPPRPLIAPRAPAGATERIATGGGIVKQLPPAAPTRQTVEAVQEAPPPVRTPTQAVPAVTSDRGMLQAGLPERSRPGSRTRTRTVNSSVHRHAREPRAAFATGPYGIHASPYADGTRNVRRRERGRAWSW
jgi:hypothetical protein